MTATTGYWKDNVRRGFMEIINNDGKKESNLYEHDQRFEPERKDEIMDYDYRYNKCARNMNYDIYIKK